ncbi:LysM peptidoglycan-binding domain-containing protein [Ectothiorhodospira lacustris]|uniref:LysM peptidoglycan-binding domain-containing protein n=1 Tax=Ectothiorhodospira lacustris TaxID=2899127 RepID=UPI001EE83210|nr:LysM peptidoglycan-binding domain-containing protein [Ectothiorhodospira lacustris]MCG5499599.1 LysM peptidoglycan-binding domain-containing protein [Ectothiorhodospira lacustris]MCG5508707.1 LysM peptidoglycan-binding domain-containing protein [Ectothiorhodospira lacustris]MCG5520498.1 LysM peptidoglycan-binding domain-containing protein [Ectothiorhodospira lacustris]
MKKNKPKGLGGALLGAAALLLSACASMDGGPSAQDGPVLTGADPAAKTSQTTTATPSRGAATKPKPRIEVARPLTHTSPAPAVDEGLWGRVRQGFALPDERDHERVLHYIQWHQANSDYLGQVLARAEPYLHYILEEIEARDLPAELLLLPVVESAYRPDVYSSGQAAGIWQFIPSTGSHFGLHQNWWYDGRKDIHASTHAALNYLTQLHERFNGDWLLALAAYNAGQGTVSRAITRNESLGQPTDYWNLDLPRETQHYVPRLLALQAIVTDPEHYQVGLWPVPDEPRLGLVELGGQLELSIAAELADLSLDDITQLNPGFHRWATDPEGPHHLLLPLDRVEPFQIALAALPREQRVSWLRHRVQPGETLGHIAARYNTTIALLQRTNELRSHIIRVGDHLLIPTAEPSPETVTARQDEGRSVSRTHNTLHHRVQPGDTLWALARTYDVSLQELAAWNRISSDATLRPGQTLLIRQAGTTTAAAQPAAMATGAARGNTLTYAVRPGDSLSSISRRFGVRVSDIQVWNQLDGHLIRPGQQLHLHLDGHPQES